MTTDAVDNMSQPAENPVRNRGRRRRVWLLGLWAVTAATLWWVWPVQPRLTLGNGDDFQIVGITPDGETLVAVTRRAVPANGQALPASGKPLDYTDVWSGPIQLWSLTTGERRSVCIPGQACSGELVDCGGRKLMLEPGGWDVSPALHPLKGRCFQFDHSCGDSSDTRAVVVLNLDTLQVHSFRKGDFEYTPEIELSPTGRWCLERRHPKDGDRERLRIVETATARESLAIEAQGEIDSHCFSADDLYFACSFNDGLLGVTEVWDLEANKRLHDIPRRLTSLAFSADDRLMAGVDKKRLKVLVIDVPSGETKHSMEVNAKDAGKLSFTPDAEQLLLHKYWWGSWAGHVPHHCLISSVHVWHLATETRVDYELPENVANEKKSGDDPERQLMILGPSEYFHDPNICENGLDAQMTPTIIARRAELIDVITGNTVFAFPPESDHPLSPSTGSVWLTRDHRTLLLSKDRYSHHFRVAWELNHRGIPMPDMLWPENRGSNDLMLVDVPSRQITAVLPNQASKCWLTSDEKTLVTISTTEPPVISVWDIPPRRPVLRPVAWSLLVPLCFLLWPLWRRCWAALFSRGRRSKPMSATTGAADYVAS